MPAELAGLYGNVEEIRQDMLLKVRINGEPVRAESTFLFDVALQVSFDGGKTWQPATEENFPAEGLQVMLPYPAGTNRKDFDFAVSHMFTITSTRLGTTVGGIETPVVTKTEDGVLPTEGDDAAAQAEGGESTEEGSGEGTEGEGEAEPEYPELDQSWKEFPVDPETGLLIDPSNGHHIDPETGYDYDSSFDSTITTSLPVSTPEAQPEAGTAQDEAAPAPAAEPAAEPVVEPIPQE